MKLAPFIILLSSCLLACEAKAPVTQVSYMGITAVERNYHLKFAANQPILDLFKENEHQKPVVAEMVCSLDADHNFDVEHRLKYFARGGIELIEKTTVAGETRFIFDSIVHFWESPENELGSDQSLAKEELDVLLKNKKEIPCKVRMTVYLSSPYYSETLLVPAADILAVARKRQMP